MSRTDGQPPKPDIPQAPGALLNKRSRIGPLAPILVEISEVRNPLIPVQPRRPNQSSILKTARAVELSMPLIVLVRTDEVTE
jgi:hypothetical protein